MNLLNRKEEESTEVSSDTVAKLRTRLARLEEERAAIDADRMLLDADLRDKWAERERKMDGIRARTKSRTAGGDKLLFDNSRHRHAILDSGSFRKSEKKVGYYGHHGAKEGTKGSGGVKIINWLLHNLPGGRQTVIVI